MQVRHIFIILFTVMGYYYAETISHGAILFGHFIYLLFVDNTGLFTIGPLYCFRAKMEKKIKKTGAKGPQQICKTGVLF